MGQGCLAWPGMGTALALRSLGERWCLHGRDIELGKFRQPQCCRLQQDNIALLQFTKRMTCDMLSGRTRDVLEQRSGWGGLKGGGGGGEGLLLWSPLPGRLSCRKKFSSLNHFAPKVRQHLLLRSNHLSTPEAEGHFSVTVSRVRFEPRT